MGLGAIATAAALPSPEGDFFDAPLLREGTSWDWSGTTLGATREPGEQWYLLGENNSIWFRWTAPVSGWAGAVCRVTNGPDQQSYSVSDLSLRIPYFGLFAYEDAKSIGELKPVGAPARTRLFGSATRFFVEAGKTYRFVFAGFGGDPSSPNHYQIWFGSSPAEVPENDSLSQSQPLGSSPAFAFFQLAKASSEPGEPGFPVYSQPPGSWGKTLWYRWTPPSSGRYVAEVQMPASMPLLAVYRLRKPFTPAISWGDLKPVQRRENRTITRQSIPQTDPAVPAYFVTTVSGSVRLGAAFEGTPGEEFLFQVDEAPPVLEPLSLDRDAAGVARTNAMGVLRIFPTPTPQDDLKFAREISDNERVFLDAPGASLEPGEPPLPVPAEGSFWWKWTAGRTLWVAPEGAVDVFTGTGWEDFKPVPLRPGDPSVPVLPRFQATAGTTYYLRTIPVDRTKTHLSLIVEAPNDRIENATEVQWLQGAFQLPEGLGSIDPGEPLPERPYFTGVVWLLWHPDRTGRFGIAGGGLSAFRQSPDGALTKVGRPISGLDSWMLNTTPGDAVFLAVPKSDAGWPEAIALLSFPSNDDFEHPVRISGTWTAEWGSDDALGTAQPGEPNHAGSPAGASRWYEYRVLKSGSITARILGKGRPRVALYRGNTLSSLVPLAAAQTGGTSEFEATASAEVVDGEVIRVAVEPGVLGGDALLPAPFSIQIASSPNHDVPSNSRFVGKTWVTSTTLGANPEPRIQRPESMSDWNSVWFHCLTGSDGPYIVRLVPNPLSTRLHSARLRVYHGSNPDALILAGESAPLASHGPIAATFVSQPAQKVWIEVLTEPDEPEFFDIQATPLDKADTLVRFALEPEEGSSLLRLQGPDDLILHLEESSDLSNWQSLGDAQVTRDGTLIALPPGPNAGLRFVRSRLP